ncbi:MAG: type II toxin-antitoxin system prevent-host-death family antitoxin [bacterium]|nr:type II toxin-antitoxin system prevent-host-death family antitoxin [bacterium]
MDTVGAYEAKTHLSKLLERVAKGERIAIEKHGVPVATLVPADPSKRKPADETIAELKRFRAGHRLDGLSIRDMIEEGRR